MTRPEQATGDGGRMSAGTVDADGTRRPVDKHDSPRLMAGAGRISEDTLELLIREYIVGLTAPGVEFRGFDQRSVTADRNDPCPRETDPESRPGHAQSVVTDWSADPEDR